MCQTGLSQGVQVSPITMYIPENNNIHTVSNSFVIYQYFPNIQDLKKVGRVFFAYLYLFRVLIRKCGT